MANNTAFPLGIFVGGPNGSDSSVLTTVTNQFNSFTNVMGTQAQFMNAYVDQAQSPYQWPSNAGWTAWSWSQMPGTSGLTPIIGLPMANSWDSGHPDSAFKAFASGQYDSELKGVVKSWADQGYSSQIWRPGYEMNIESMPWFVGSDKQTQADYVSAFQHVSKVLKDSGQSLGVDVKIVWSPNIQNWNGSIDVMSLYPGNQAVDIIGPDQYDNMYPRDLYDWGKNDGSHASSFQEWASSPANVQHYFNYPSGNMWSPTGDGQGNGQSLQSFIDLAKANGKPIALSETGAGGGRGTDTWENPSFVKWLSSTLSNAGVPVSYVSIWDVDDNGDWDFSSSSADKPATAAAWRQYFGAGSGDGAAAAPSGTVVAPAASPATSSGSFIVYLSEDSWQGDAQVTISIDGRQIGGTQTVTASHGAGQSQAIELQGSFDSSAHKVSINFLNDGWGGSSATDRNVYVDKITANGETISPSAGLYGAGAQDFTVPAALGGVAFLTSAATAVVAGDATIVAQPAAMLDFSAGNFGSEIVTSFDTSSNSIKLGTSQAANSDAVLNDLSTSGNSTVITLDNAHTITLQGVAASSLTSANFTFG